MFEFFVFSLLFEALWLLASGDFFDTIKTEGTGGARQVWQVKKYGIPDFAQIVEGCRIFSCSQAGGGRLPASQPAVTS
ncbi:MAG: hypothetical protein J6A20_09550, partial [Muribaculaceae bacterium]|nr:hypothetical protein [Muribaculaceae bacterium]